MKILKKNEIQAVVAKQKREQIDEGIALATKVDILRSTVDSLEQQQERFMVGMKRRLETEIEPLTHQKSLLKSDIEIAQRELVRLRLPLDDEWKRAKKEADLAREKTQALNIRESKLIEAEEDIKNDRDGIRVEKEALASLRRDALEETVLAGDIKSEADRILRKTKIESEHKIDELTKREKALRQWEQDLNFKEVDLDNRESFVVERTKVLNDKERFINDKYATLERTVNRLNNQ